MQGTELQNEHLLIAAFKDGEVPAFEKIFKFYYPLLIKVANYYLDKPDAEEVVQDLFYGIWEKKQTLEIRSNFKGYLLLAVKNKCLNSLRRKKDLLIDDQPEFLNESSEKADSGLMARQAKDSIDRAINKLPEQCRIIFLLHRQEHLTYKEIATLLEIAPKTVENQIGKALKILQAELKDLLPFYLMLLASK